MRAIQGETVETESLKLNLMITNRLLLLKVNVASLRVLLALH